MKLPPWTFIVIAWVVLLVATFFTVRICRNNAPEEVALDNQTELAGPHAR
jgi:hypothetical protein